MLLLIMNDNMMKILLSPNRHLREAYGGSAWLLAQFHRGKLSPNVTMILITEIWIVKIMRIWRPFGCRKTAYYDGVQAPQYGEAAPGA